MSIKAIVFDMDGVLIDAKEWHYDALNQALELFGFTIPRVDHETRYDGLPTKTKLGQLSECTTLPTALHGFINQMKQVYTLSLARELLRPDPQHVEMLSTLKANGYVLGVASNSVRTSVDLMMDLAGLSPFLDFTLSNDDVVSPKPAPEIYTTAMRLARVMPHECLVVEDNPFGWKAALGAGAHLLKVANVQEVSYENVIGAVNQANAEVPRSRAA
ncbi:HAD family phosphatase [Bremerella sp. JC817]|uniref:HAD family hydrolase n=1 Tax=Bremerella sp. JC817 TaxID=3231756 RepID=UPI00345AADCE